MDDWFNHMAAGCELPKPVLQELLKSGFVIIPGPMRPDQLQHLTGAYDAAVATASGDDKSATASNIRVHNFVNRGGAFDELYIYLPILEACCRVIKQPFKLSSLLARTILPHSQAQGLHADFRRDRQGWPMIGFILMIDEFRADNGATRFIPGSHRWSSAAIDQVTDLIADDSRQVLATGLAGSVIIYNGSVLHGFTANQSDEPRRSIQGAYIRRDAESGSYWAARVLPQTRERIGPLARYLLAL